jgi:hypothetical protein
LIPAVLDRNPILLAPSVSSVIVVVYSLTWIFPRLYVEMEWQSRSLMEGSSSRIFVVPAAPNANWCPLVEVDRADLTVIKHVIL